MIIKNKNFVKIIVFSILLSIMFIWSFSFVVDPYGKNNKFVFKGNKEKIVRDERTRKFDLIIKNPAASSFMFGSSRGLMLSAEKLGYLTGTESLNLAFSSASAHEYYLFIKYLLETRKVSNIIIGIDLFAYTKNFISNGVMPPELLSYFGIDDGYSMKSYLSSKIFSHSLDTLKRNYSDDFKPTNSYSPRGKIIKNFYLQAKNNEVDFKKYITTHVIEDSIHWGSTTSELSAEQLSYLLKIKNICDEYKVNLYLFMSPLYIKQIKMKNNRFKQQQQLLKYIVNNISPVMDYNGITKINIDPFSFLDSFHYSYDVADMIVEKFFLESLKRSNNLVTKENIENYIDDINKKLLD